MSTERVVVRMSRSDPSIPWAIHFRSIGVNLSIASVPSDGLSAKAGVQVNDNVIELCGRKVTVDEAERLIREPRLDIDMILSRMVTSHTCLPWNLTEKGNEVVVDRIGSHSMDSNNWLKNGRSEVISGSSNSSWNNPLQDQSRRQQTNNYSYSNTSTNSQQNRNEGYSSSRAPFASTTTSIPIVSSTSNRINTSSIPSSIPSPVPHYSSQLTTRNGGYNKGVVDTSRSVPLTQQTYIDTSNQGGNRTTTLSPNSGSIFYHSPQSRTRRELSPGASIHHLQYNSPMNLYSSDTAAEQYEMQTGQHIDKRFGSKSPSYLNSETRKLIEEEEGRMRGPSPSHQSPCFDRISHAVHADNY